MHAPGSIEMCDVSTQLLHTSDSSYINCFSIVRRGPRSSLTGKRIRNAEGRVVTKQSLLVCYNLKC